MDKFTGKLKEYELHKSGSGSSFCALALKYLPKSTFCWETESSIKSKATKKPPSSNSIITCSND